MVYKAKYRTWTKVDSKTNKKTVSGRLEAKFRFGNEVSKIDRQLIRGRYIGYFPNELRTVMAKFLQGRHRIDITTKRGSNYWYEVTNTEGETRSYIPSPAFRLGFNMIVITEGSNAELPIEEVLDLEGLDKAILTGEIPNQIYREENLIA